MKTFISIMAALVLGSTATLAATTNDKVMTSNVVSYAQPFIFTENGITFSVYPDGEFDFYMNDRVNVGANVNFGNAQLTFNSGYNYDPYVQYDDYGAVIQVENVPIYYDYYGRVSQIGDINVWYRNGRVHRIGGMYAYYNPRGIFTHYTGYVNIYNRHYVYQPWHGYFVRPSFGFCLVYNRPYRQYYYPARYTYYRPYSYNYRKAYARVGNHYKYQKQHKRRDIYRNDRRVVERDYNHGRRGDNYRTDRAQPAKRQDYNRGGDNYRSNRETPVRREAVSNNRNSVKRNDADYSRRSSNQNSSRTVQQGDRRSMERGNSKAGPITRGPEAKRDSRAANVQRERTVTQRSVNRSPGNKTVTRNSNSSSVRKPANSGRTVKPQSRTERTISSRSSSPDKSRGDYKKSSVNRSAGKAPSRATRSSQGISVRSKSKRVQ